MAKAKTNSTKKATVAKKKPASSSKKTLAASRRPTPAKKAAAKPAKKPAAAKKAASTANKIVPAYNTSALNVELLPPDLVERLREQINSLFNEWESETANNLTLLQRRRKTGPGNSNYGFIDKVSDIAMVNPEYAGFINIADLKNAIRNIEACRDLFAILQSFARAVSNTMMIYSTAAFDLALDYYSQVKVRADRGDPKAIELYRILKTRFRKTKRISEEPTVKEIERDVHAILTHKKDGEVDVKGKSPKVIRGATEVVDDVHTGKAKIKGKFDEQEDN